MQVEDLSESYVYSGECGIKLEKRRKVVTEDEKKMPVLEALHSALIPSDESDEEGDVLRTRPLEWRSEEVSILLWSGHNQLEAFCTADDELSC
ncbi:unnamed protein product [Porites evermanni]|uniref:Uncharacterized protein n=1 Tax=Porites evermanni TaxID=104178 RepID=A0ABN8LEH1_9CNID|nr:unnamed protein product [Porites evermanni]